MSPQIAEGLRIMGVGIGGVFANLLILMAVVSVLGAVFGKKKKNKKKKKEPKGTGGGPDSEKGTAPKGS
jgi:Na+-transporting methylmalonyl-CoA/oxaloacetate decarboxylase gamma subunit